MFVTIKIGNYHYARGEFLYYNQGKTVIEVSGKVLKGDLVAYYSK